MSAVAKVLFLPIRFALFVIEVLGRTVALFLGLALFGLGAFFCFLGPLVILGAPLVLLGLILVFKAIG